MFKRKAGRSKTFRSLKFFPLIVFMAYGKYVARLRKNIHTLGRIACMTVEWGKRMGKYTKMG
jgi:hypothetical protein